ncbi:PqqD family protein [Streptomyces sp. NBC_00996]|uniref:PqqD family protein n=1 Tax=Streptomyces sp. NBC_00996 TaxID=2903710 RepID=UPI0038675769|nr:PqqD family protein [Streptomyces sp. NBC_00996]
MSDNGLRSLDDVPRRVLGTRIRLVRGDYHIGADDVALHLTGPGNIIFASLDGRRSVADVARLLVAEFGIDQEEAIADVREFLDELTDRGIVE